jgi:HD-like signal output (HDOD) protein
MTQAPEEFSGRLAEGKDWREIVAWVSDLPPMPHVAQKALKLVEDPSCSAPELAKVLTADAALAARVLKIANSAMFARQREITTLNQAIMLIGLKALKGVVVAATLRQMTSGQSKLEQLIWENSMFSAMIASKVAIALKFRWHEEVFLLSLLHTLGQIVLISQKATSELYGNVLKQIQVSGVDYVSAEQQVLGFAHPLIGALVAKKWNFPGETCQVILHYRDPVESLESDVEKQIAVVQLADAVSHSAKVGSPDGYPDQSQLIARLCGLLKLESEVLSKIVEDVKAQFEKERSLYFS